MVESPLSCSSQMCRTEGCVWLATIDEAQEFSGFSPTAAGNQSDVATFALQVLPQELVFAGAINDQAGGRLMDGLIYLIGLIVVVMAILSFLGLR